VILSWQYKAFIMRPAGSFMETQKSSRLWPQPSDPFAFSNRRFHRVFKPALTVPPSLGKKCSENDNESVKIIVKPNDQRADYIFAEQHC
jgi:hypothetical protein